MEIGRIVEREKGKEEEKEDEVVDELLDQRLQKASEANLEMWKAYYIKRMGDAI